jgi:hypothetical protein
MKARRPSRVRLNGIVIHEIQRLRLVRIARGEIEPNCEREGFFQWSLLEGYRPKYGDFILPPILYLWEQERADDEDDDAAGEAADVTAS